VNVSTVLMHRGVLSLVTGIASAALGAGLTWQALQGRVSALENKAERSENDSRCVRERLERMDANLQVIATDMGWVKEALRELKGRGSDRP